MDSTLTAVIVGLVPTIAAGAFAARQTRRLARVNFDLETERKLRDRALNAEDVLTRYSEPLAAAAFDLQSRCYNICKLGFFERFGPSHDRFPEAETTTLFRFAQYFGWSEILRRDVQFLSFPENEHTQLVTRLQIDIARRMAASDHDEPLMVWADEQRAIGERMIVHEHDRTFCIGYARFCDTYDECFASLCRRMRADLADPAALTRLRDVQRLLCELVSALDSQQLRYSAKDLGLA